MAGPDDEVLYPWRSFEAYPILTTVAGARSVQVPLRPDQSFDLDALAAAVTARTRVMFVCSPNNPTGTVVLRADLETLLDRVPSGVLVVLDEAYREFVTDADVPDGTAYLDRANVLVLRTFSKAYGLAGLRVGYGVAADPAVARALRQVQIPFAVSTIAQEAALACLEPEAEKQLSQRVDEVVSERSRVYDRLADLGYPVVPSQANFVWIPLGDATTEWARGCEERGVIVRPFAGARASASPSAPPPRTTPCWPQQRRCADPAARPAISKFLGQPAPLPEVAESSYVLTEELAGENGQVTWRPGFGPFVIGGAQLRSRRGPACFGPEARWPAHVREPIVNLGRNQLGLDGRARTVAASRTAAATAVGTWGSNTAGTM